MELKEQILENLSKKKLTSSKLRSLMKIKGEEEQATFFSALNELEISGKVYQDKDGYFQIFKEKTLGKVQGSIHITDIGKGFIIKNTSTGKKKYLISKENLNGALDGDIVVLEDIRENKTNYIDAKVEKIVKRLNGNAVFEFDGETFAPHGMQGEVKVICPKESIKKLVEGSLVLVTLGKDAIANFDIPTFEGKIKAVIGHKNDPDIEVAAIGATHGFLTNFPEPVLKELETIPTEVKEDELEGRVDLRGEEIFTIDGIDTKDMDDAISIKKDGENYILGVHIADVNHYVKKGSALDNEAKVRGTSAYLADYVLPMLPHQLSNGICSLNENVDRLTKTVTMTIDKNGKVIDYDIFNSVINSKKKMTYDDVNLILENKENPAGYEEFITSLKLMEELSHILSDKRKNRGNIDFASNEVKTIITSDGTPTLFKNCEQKSAEKLIENFMILANETVTKHYSYMGLPFVYRVHGDPHDDKLCDTIKFLKQEGLCGKEADKLINKIENGTYRARDLEEFINSFKGTDNYSVISNYILTSMSKAKYSPTNEGHYGLALDHYTHFTSPIRRYPDLEVHRLIDEYNNYEEAFKKLDEIEEELPEICAHSSYMERQADAAERETTALKMAEYAMKHVGEEFYGQIVNMTPYGVNVKLDNNIRVYAPIEELSKAKKKFNRTYKLGSKVFALIKEVSIPHKVVYFEITEFPKNRKKEKVIKK